MKVVASRNSQYADVNIQRFCSMQWNLQACRHLGALGVRCPFYGCFCLVPGRWQVLPGVFLIWASCESITVPCVLFGAPPSGSALDDNHSQRHVAEGGRIACPMLQFIADPVEVESAHGGALAKIDPELIDGQQLAAAKRADVRIGDALLMLDRPE